MKLKPRDADRALSQPDGSYRIYLIYGPDLGMVRERADTLSKALVKDPDDPFAVTRLTDDDVKADPAALADALAALSMTGDPRLVRVRLSGDSAPVARLLTEVDDGVTPSEATLVIESGDLRKTSKLRKAAEDGKRSLAAPCYADNARDLIGLAEEMFRAENLSLDPDARAMLAPFLEGDRALARSEIEKLILYKGLATQRGGDAAQITRQDIADISAVGSEAAMDQILDPALGGDVRAADAAYARGLSAGLNPVGVLRGLQRRIDQFDTFHTGGGDAGALTRAGAPRFGPPADQFKRSARLWTGRRLDQARKYAFDAERAVKRSGAPAEALVGDLILRLSRAAANARR